MGKMVVKRQLDYNKRKILCPLRSVTFVRNLVWRGGGGARDPCCHFACSYQGETREHTKLRSEGKGEENQEKITVCMSFDGDKHLKTTHR